MSEALFPSESGALFSCDRLYRYRLWRVWNKELPRALFVMMNPSTADEVNNDATIARQVRRVTRWDEMLIKVTDKNFSKGFGSVEVVNVFAWRETDSTKLPKLVKAGTDIVGPDNDKHILNSAKVAGVVICGWGLPARERGRDVLKMFAMNKIRPYALFLTKDGTPGHPLYLPYTMEPERIPMPFCCQCGCEIHPGDGLCGECSCEDDCAP